MKLRNKKTGEIGYLRSINWDETSLIIMNKDGVQLGKYNSLAELNKEWEDAPEEPKGIQCIYYVNHFDKAKIDGVIVGFSSKEEAEKAVEKFKAWKRLKDKGFRFERWLLGGEYGNTVTFSDYFKSDDEARADLDLLFSGEDS